MAEQVPQNGWLHNVWLNDNGIEDIGSLEGVDSLGHLYLQDNRIRDISALKDKRLFGT